MVEPVENVEFDRPLRWYVVHCKPQREQQAATALEQYLSVAAYVPEIQKRVRGKTKIETFFPGYLFLRADLAHVGTSRINSTPNVLRLLDFGGGPQTVPDAVVEAIREQIALLNAHAAIPGHNLRQGDRVVLTEGPLKGLEAVFLGPMPPSARVKVLLYFLGRPNEVMLDVDTLEGMRSTRGTEVAPQEPEHTTPPFERRTRGRGRKINK